MGDTLETVSTVISVAMLVLVQAYPAAALLIMASGVTAQYLLASAIGPRGPELPKSAGLGINARSTIEPIKVLYGQLRVGGNDVYIATTGNDNKTLWIVQTLSEGECEGIYQEGGVDQAFVSDLLYNEFGGNVSYTFHAGTSAQTVDVDLNAADPLWTDTLRYTSYIVWKFTFDENYFQSFPQRTTVLQGRKLYDPRDLSTVYSNNPVLCLYDYMTSSRYGLGLASAKIDTASWNPAATYCDTQGWTFNYRLTGEESAQDVIDIMLASFRGSLVWWDGKYYLKYADLNDEASIMTLTDDDILIDDSGKAQISLAEPSKFGIPDGISVQYTNPDEGYIPDSFIIGESEGVIDELNLTMCTSKQQAADLAVYDLERKILNRSVEGVFRDRAIKIEAEDIVTLTSSALSISDTMMRAKEANILPSGNVQLSLAYESINLYDDSFNLHTEGVYKCTLPDPRDEPPSVTNVQRTEEQYDYRLRNFTRLKVTFDEPSDYAWFKHVEVHVSYDNIDWEHLFDVNTDFEIDPIEEGITYYIRLKTVSIWGTKQIDINDYKFTHQVEGYTNVPTSLASLDAVVNVNSINLYSVKVDDPDVELYEFRLGASWSGSLFLSALRSPNLSLYGVKPGNHTFIANTLGNNGFYGDTPRTAVVTLKDPPDEWAVTNTETCEYEDYFLISEDCGDIAGWADADVGDAVSSQVTFDGKETFKFDSVTGAFACRTRDAGSIESFGNFFTVKVKLYHDNIGTNAEGDYFILRVCRSDVRLYIKFCSDGLFIYDGAAWNEVGVNLVVEDAWQEWRFEVDVSAGVANAVCDVYLDDVLKGTDEDCSEVGAFTDGDLWLYQYGTTNNNLISYVDYLRVDQGFDNMEPYLYTGDYYVKCSHHEGVYTGTFTSPIYDRGASARYLIYCLAEVVVLGEGTTWDDVMPDPDLWNDIDISTNCWIDIFEIPEGPSVQIKLKYGAASPPTSKVDRLEILSAIVTGRYFQIEITITDPNNQVNALVDSFDLKFCQ